MRPIDVSCVRVVRLLRWVVLLALCAAPVSAQDFRGSIIGRVNDSSGARLPGATVTATNTATNVGSRTTTNGDGNYSVLYLTPGTYTVAVELAGFRRVVREGVEVRVPVGCDDGRGLHDRIVALDEGDGLDLDLRARGERGDLDRGARRRDVSDVPGVDLVHPGEVAEIGEVDGRLDEALETATCSLQDRSRYPILETGLFHVCPAPNYHDPRFGR